MTEKVLRKARCPVLTVPPPVTEPPTDALRLFKRILCPVDFSESSLKALEYALSLAKEADAELLLMHVIEGLADLKHWQQPPSPCDRRVSPPQRAAGLGAAARAWYRRTRIRGAGRTRAPRDRQTLRGDSSRLHEKQDVHLIVMGVHGRNPIDLLFFGSTTQQVVRASTCPVLTLRT